MDNNKQLVQTHRTGLLLNKKIANVPLFTMLANGFHKLEILKESGDVLKRVSIPDDMDLLLGLVPEAHKYLPDGYKVIAGLAKFRKCIDDMKVTVDDDGAMVIPEPPMGLSALEAIMWVELGPMSSKSCAFLYKWFFGRSWKKASAYTGLTGGHLNLLRRASTMFETMYNLIDATVRDGHHQEAIEEIHRRGVEGIVRDVYGATVDEDTGKSTGTGVVGQKKEYDTKLILKQAEAGDRRNWGSGAEREHKGTVMNVTFNNLGPDVKPEDIISVDPEAVLDVEDAEEV